MVNGIDTTPEALAFLEGTEARLKAVLTAGGAEVSHSDTLLNAGRHLCVGSGGKRLRPMMVHLFGLAAGAPEGALQHVAVAAELVHSASLLHDDVMDAGMYRRGRPTVNALWGNVVAVMGGDLLLTLALDELSGLEREVTFAAVRTVAEMTRATIGEVEARGDLAVSVERFRSIMEGKTGALFGFCGAAAGRLAGRDDVARRFETFGRHLGVAFQIADDLKDLNGGDPGKPAFADFKSRTPSLPILLAAQQEESLRRRIKDLWAFGSMSDERVRELGIAVLASDAPAAALKLMDREIAAALDALGNLREAAGADQLANWGRRLGEAFRT